MMYKQKGSSRSCSDRKQKARKSCGKKSSRSRSIKRQKAGKNSEKKNPRLVAFEEKFGNIDDYGQDAWNELDPKVVEILSGTVVPVASFNGNQMHFGCAGIVVRSNEAGATVVTTASLIRSLGTERILTSVLRIEVHLPNMQLSRGFVIHYDIPYNIAVIIIPPFPGLRAARFDHHMEFGSGSKVVAVGCWYWSRQFMAATGILTDEPKGDHPDLRNSTCKIPMVMTGGPLIDLDGNFVGMNFYSKEGTPFLPWNKIFDFLVLKYELILEDTVESPTTGEIEDEDSEPNLKSTPESPLSSIMLNSEGSSSGESEPEDDDPLFDTDFYKPLPVDEFTELVRNDLRTHGYPMPTRLEGGMRLVNTFEEEFAENTWCNLSKRVSSDASRSVVSLASFKGKERFFACSGIFIDFKESTSRVLTSASLVRTSADEDKIADNLKIEVYLPNGQLATGTLEHYNLTYNVAVVSIIGFRCVRTAKFCGPEHILAHREVVAVGRVFQSGKLMATSGIVTDKDSKLDCNELRIATCKITKAGIGGPLIDVDGNFIGMNFYSRKETHFLPKAIILELLETFDAERAVDDTPISNRWPVPVCRWSYPSSRPPCRLGVCRLE